MRDPDGPTYETAATTATSQSVKAQSRLRELILEGRLQAGARISELWVVEQLGVSRTPVRAALVRLQEEGFLEPIPSGGFAVRSFTQTDVWDAIEVRGTLEGLAARLAAERGVERQVLHDLRACVERIDAIIEIDVTEEKFAAYIAENETFHWILVAACQSGVVERQIEKATASPFASPSGFVMVQSMTPDSQEMLILAQMQHKAVIDAIERREGARAEALMREHARIAHTNLKSAFENPKVMAKLQGRSLIRRYDR